MNKKKLQKTASSSEILLYQTEDGRTKLEVRFEGETAWLTQKQLAELFQKDVRTINEHIQNIFDEGELTADSVIRNFRITATDGKNYDIQHYNLDVIIAAGYRVRSHRGTQFRVWATEHLREFIVKGFTLDDERLKRNGVGNYFEELLERIRDIRSAEKVFWRKVLDIYATSIDYDPATEISQQFFATVQNKMHWAAHGKTAAEVVVERADASLPYMGMTSWAGSTPRKTDASIAKNYLNQEELEVLNRIVSAYLEYAELRARNRKPMYMRDWIAKLDDFLRLSEKEILSHAGSVAHEAAIEHAETEFEKYRIKRLRETSSVEEHFEQALKKLVVPNALKEKRKKRN